MNVYFNKSVVFFFQVSQLQLRSRVQPVADVVSVRAEPRLANELTAASHVFERREKRRDMCCRGVLVIRHVQDSVGFGRKWSSDNSYRSRDARKKKKNKSFAAYFRKRLGGVTKMSKHFPENENGQK